MVNKISIVMSKIYDIFLMALIYVVSIFIKRREDCIAFGSWMGKLYIDNSRYLAEHMDKANHEYNLFWIGEKHVRKEIPEESRIRFIQINSLESIIVLLRCKYIFCTQMHDADISRFNVFRGAIICYLHHGMPVKKWGSDALKNSDQRKQKLFKKVIMRIYSSYFGRNRKYQYFVTSSLLHDISNCTALSFRGCTMQQNIPSGTPRNDILINYDSEKAKSLKKDYSQELGFDYKKKIVMYLPTYRRTNSKMFSFLEINNRDKAKIERVLYKNNAIILEKSHFSANKQTFIKDTAPMNVYNIDRNVNLQEMLLFTDIIISDYSGVFLDFILLNRPVIHFAYDYYYYKNFDSGLYYDIKDFAAGKITNTLEETLKELEQILLGNDKFNDKRAYVRKKYMTYEVGKASQKIVEAVIYRKGRKI